MEDMIADEEWKMLEATYPPYTFSYYAEAVFRAIQNYSDIASDFIGGMSANFKGLDKDYLIRNSKRFTSVDLSRYEYYIDLYSSKLAEIYNNSKDSKDG
jgi:hypothetical protein